ncbi:MAG: UDP-N-acetylmuramate dehydrogenase [Planctomycetes bacterium]|nr:UDP-N-acetylmuramate dehydrogenase [Planctomycetota bacterium]
MAGAVMKPELTIGPAPIPTWFQIGGTAERFARIDSLAQLRTALDIDPGARTLGDGANLLVDDDGVADLVLALGGEFNQARIDSATGAVHVGAGYKLPKLINDCVNVGCAGLEALAGFPATLGGCIAMNAGGRHGEISQFVQRVHIIDRNGRQRTLERADIPFTYRSSGLGDTIVTSVELQLQPGADIAALKLRQREIMEFKKASQPLSASSAGCCFKNPTLMEAFQEFAPGTRVGAGLIIDRAGLKGLAIGGASVSPQHANFVVTTKDAKARDVIALLAEITRRVHDTCGIQLHREVVIWSRHTD